METFFNKSELISKAILLGANAYVQKLIPNQFGNPVFGNKIFSTHFLNAEDKEVAYFIDNDGIYQTQGLKENKHPKHISTGLTLTQKVNLI